MLFKEKSLRTTDHGRRPIIIANLEAFGSGELNPEVAGSFFVYLVFNLFRH